MISGWPSKKKLFLSTNQIRCLLNPPIIFVPSRFRPQVCLIWRRVSGWNSAWQESRPSNEAERPTCRKEKTEFERFFLFPVQRARHIYASIENFASLLIQEKKNLTKQPINLSRPTAFSFNFKYSFEALYFPFFYTKTSLFVRACVRACTWIWVRVNEYAQYKLVSLVN